MPPAEMFELILVWLAFALVLGLLAERMRLPPAAAFTVGGIGLALIPGFPPLELNPDLIMVLFLPPLLLASAYFTSWRDFRGGLRPILLLAIGAVTFTTAVVGWAAKIALPDLPWAACFTLGAIVSPPDAVAAKAVLQRLHLPRRLTAVLEGESLVNDASGLVLYRFALAATLTGTFHAGTAIGTGIVVAIGGIAIGLAISFIVNALFRRISQPQVATVLSFLAAWLTYIVADDLHLSGVLAVVACGLLMGRRQHEVLSAQVRAEARAVWQLVVFVMEALVFILIGFSLRAVLTRMGGPGAALAAGLPLALATTGAVILSRFAWVYPATYLSRLIPWVRKHDPSPPLSVPLVISWAGMRGVVSLAAALALPDNFPGRDQILFATFVVILATVLVQGATIGPLIRMLGILEPAGASETTTLITYHDARAAVADASLQALRAITNAEGTPLHPNLIEDFQRRQAIMSRLRAGGDDTARRRNHYEAWLLALAAGRRELVQLHHADKLHDEIVRAVEGEIDFEELRVRQMLEKLDVAD